MYLLKVLIEYQNINIDRTFEYYSINKVELYSRVLVSFNNRKVVGFVCDVIENGKSEFNAKTILEVVDEKPIINEELFKVSKFMQSKYLASQIQALQTMLPSGFKPSSNQKKEVVYDTYLLVLEGDKKLSEKQEEIFNKLKDNEDIKLSEALKIGSNHIINELVKKEYLKKIKKPRKYYIVNKEMSSFKTLNQEQEEVYNKIISSSNKSFLLHGITGSGKTEIFLHLANYYINQGKSVLVLVPEITLTIMMQEQFASRFENQIAILHSKLSNSQRYQEYQKIRDNKVKIVVGTRSSIFAPLNNLGIIIVDEEHDSSYKQHSNLMYDVHDIADYRISLNDAKVVYASATPSMISFTKAYTKHYEYLRLNNRYLNQPLPEVEVVDLNYQALGDVVSKRVIDQMNEFLEKDKQVIVLLNRRGYNNMFQCRDCKETLMCPHCNVALTYHHKKSALMCHHCGYTTHKIDTCFYCGSKDLKRLGFGIQKIEEYLESVFNKYNIIRIDHDAIKNVNQLEKMIDSFKNKEADILIGTQMIAKGLDFDSADLVVVLNIDASLAFNSYDAIESAFTLLSQVAGRAGRHSGEGKVLVETFQPEHYVMHYLKEHNYLGFYQQEMQARKKYDNPPYFKIAQILISGLDETLVNKEAYALSQYLKEKLNNVQVFDNMDHPIYKLQNTYRQQIIIKYKDVNDIKKVLYNVKKTYQNKRNFNLTIDLEY
ncbi:MAG: primosomal protein N' [Erysipelotrichales bacterium]